MKRSLTILFCMLLVCVAGCTKIQEENLTGNSPSARHSAETRSETGPSEGNEVTVLGEQLVNPYSLDVMNAAYAELTQGQTRSGGESLLPTDLYVRFLPASVFQIEALDSIGLMLFDYPLDYEVVSGGEYYHDPELPEDQITWQYTTVKPDFVFPDSIRYEILQECYIPDIDKEVPGTSSTGEDSESFASRLERKALELAGVEIPEDPATRGIFSKPVRPTGYVYVYDNTINSYVPVKGVKVRCHYSVRGQQAHTGENGYFSMDGKFQCNPSYNIWFTNASGFTIYNNAATLFQAKYNYGTHSRHGYDIYIGPTMKSWPHAIINNAGYDYYRMCDNIGIHRPENDLEIWKNGSDTSGAAPMLSEISNLNIKHGFLSSIGSWALQWLGGWMPDVMIGTASWDAREIYYLVYHEFTHASHFRYVGRRYWEEVVGYTVDCYLQNKGTYGNPTLPRSGYCAVTEMIAFAMSNILAAEKYDPNGVRDSNNRIRSYPGTDRWFKPQIIWDLYCNGVLTKNEILSCTDSSVKTTHDLMRRYLATYPSKSREIERTFLNYGWGCPFCESGPCSCHNYAVYMTDAGPSKVGVIKEIRTLTGIGLKEAKDLVDNCPSIIQANLTKAEASAASVVLSKAQASVEWIRGYGIRLTNAGNSSISIIKYIREITGIGLKEAKDLVDNCPSHIKTVYTHEEAETIIQAIGEIGGTATCF